MSIDLVTFYDNTSALQDEYLAHRLGLVPLRVEQGVEFDYNVDCECEDNCEKCSVMFTLDVSYAKKDAMRCVPPPSALAPCSALSHAWWPQECGREEFTSLCDEP
jgi:hypothetical protein